jgi:hypothetical protein
MSLGRESSLDKADAVLSKPIAYVLGRVANDDVSPAGDLLPRFPTPPRVMPFVLVSTLGVRHLESLSPMPVTFQMDDRCLEYDFQAPRSK